MSDLTFSGDIDLSPALGSVDELASTAAGRLDEALASVADTFAQALSSAATDALANLGEPALGVTADVAPAEAEVASLVSNVDGEQATIAVDADTSQAEEAASSLGDSLDSAATSASRSSGAVKEFGDSAAFVAGSAALSRGEVGGLGEVVTGAGLASAGAVAGVAALGGSVFELAQKGIEATAAEQRFNTILGETKAAVENIEVGSLSADLAKLGIEFGSTDAQVKNSASSLFQFAINSGASRAQAAQFTDEVVALSARAVSLNPNLGTLSDVADSLGVRLARGGRFAAAYGLSLTAADINARALANTHKSAAGDLTIFEKSQAAAQLAVEKYGNTLGTVVAAGAKNAANENKSLKAQLDQILETAGKPLVGGIFAAIKAALPDVLAVAVPLARIGTDLLPAVAAAASITGPPLRLVADVLKDVPAPVLTAAAGAVILNSVLSALAGRLGLIATEAPAAAAGIEEIAAAEATGTAASAGFFGAISLGSVTAGQALLAVGVGIAAYEATTAVLHLLFDRTIDYAGALRAENEEAKKVAATHGSDLVNSYERLSQRIYDTDVALVKQGSEIGNVQGHWVRLTDQYGTVTDKFVVTNRANAELTAQLRAFRDVTEQNFAAGAELNTVTDSGSALYRGQRQILIEVYTAKLRHAEATHAAAEATAGEHAAVTPATQALDNYATATATATTNTKDFKSALHDLITQQGDVFDSQTGLAKAATSLSTSLHDNGTSFDASTEAGQKNREALSGARTAAEQLADAITKQTGSADAGKAAMQFFTGSLEQTLSQAGLTRQQVDDLVRSIGLIPTDTPPTKITADTAAAQSSVDAYLSTLQQLRDLINQFPQLDIGAVLAPGVGLPHASGGPVDAGTAYPVGELGPELFVPQTAGTIIPNGVYRPGTGGGGGGASNRAAQGGATFQIDRVVMEQATPNPVRETIRAAKQLRDAAAMARM